MTDAQERYWLIDHMLDGGLIEPATTPQGDRAYTITDVGIEVATMLYPLLSTLERDGLRYAPEGIVYLGEPTYVEEIPAEVEPTAGWQLLPPDDGTDQGRTG
jgi:hypothetical protein